MRGLIRRAEKQVSLACLPYFLQGARKAARMSTDLFSKIPPEILEGTIARLQENAAQRAKQYFQLQITNTYVDYGTGVISMMAGPSPVCSAHNKCNQWREELKDRLSAYIPHILRYEKENLEKYKARIMSIDYWGELSKEEQSIGAVEQFMAERESIFDREVIKCQAEVYEESHRAAPEAGEEKVSEYFQGYLKKAFRGIEKGSVTTKKQFVALAKLEVSKARERVKKAKKLPTGVRAGAKQMLDSLA